jgi:3-phytase
VVTTDPAVDADDPALWADRRDPSRAVMFGTDKTDGLYVHNLDGSVRQFLPSGALNNVDLRTGFPAGGRDMVLVAASNDEGFGLNLYLFDPATLETAPWGFVPTQPFEPYGFCIGRRGADFYLVANSKTGDIRIWRVAAGPAGPVTTLERTLQVGSQPEGCVVDDEADVLYVGEEDVALWRFDFDPAGSSTPVRVAAADGQRFTADIEGVTIMRDRGVAYLIASSQGDNTFPVYRIEGEEHIYLGRFAIIAGEQIDAVTQTDGLDAWSGPIGAFPDGVVAFHDHADDPNRGQQNYKLVDWRDIRRALRIGNASEAGSP